MLKFVKSDGTLKIQKPLCFWLAVVQRVWALQPLKPVSNGKKLHSILKLVPIGSRPFMFLACRCSAGLGVTASQAKFPFGHVQSLIIMIAIRPYPTGKSYMPS